MSCQPSKGSQSGTSHVEVEFPFSTSTSFEDDVINEDDSEANPPVHSIAVNRPRREIRPPPRYAHADLVAYALTIAENVDSFSEPSCYEEGVQSHDAAKWITAMKEEMESLKKNRT